MIFGKSLNEWSEQLLGRQILYKGNNNNELFIKFDDRIKLSLLAAFIYLFFYGLSRLFYYVFSQTYRELSLKDKMFWSLATVRGMGGLLGGPLAAYALYFDNEPFNETINQKTELSYILIPNFWGFFIFEWCSQIYFDFRFQTFNYQLHAHHMTAFFGLFFCVFYDHMHYVGLWSFTLELSTPFSCISYLLIKMKMSKSLLWSVNQFTLVHTFHMRSLIEMKMIYDIYKNWEQLKYIPAIELYNFVFGIFAIFLFLTPYWTWKKTQQLFTKTDFSSSEDLKKKSKAQ